MPHSSHSPESAREPHTDSTKRDVGLTLLQSLTPQRSTGMLTQVGLNEGINNGQHTRTK